MPAKKVPPSDAAAVRAYVARLHPKARARVKQMMAIVKKLAPRATLSLTYGIPTYKIDGERFVYVAGWAKHTSLYPLNAGMREGNEAALKGYKTAKGTIQFPLDDPLDTKLFTRLVKSRLKAMR